MEATLEQELGALSLRLGPMRGRADLPVELVDIVGRTTMLQLESLQRIDLPALRVNISPEQHAEGEALAERRVFAWSPEECGRLFGSLLALMKAQGGQFAPAADAVRAVIASGDLLLDSACRAAVADDVAWFAQWATLTPEAPGFIQFLTQSAVSPSVVFQARTLARQWQGGALLEQSRIWAFGVCPICGSAPMISRMTPNSAAHWCTCSFCRHEYRIIQVQCPYCLEENPERLNLLLVEEDPGYQAQTCDTCGMYIKVASGDVAEIVPLPVIDDLESLALDVLAANEGFRRPSGSTWGF